MGGAKRSRARKRKPDAPRRSKRLSTPEPRHRQLLNREPALIMGAAQASIALAVSFGADLSGEQVAALMGCLAAVMSVIVRRRVTPLKP